MRIVSIGKKNIACGLDWSLFEAKKSAAKFLKKAKAAAFVFNKRVSGDFVVSFIEGGKQQKIPRGDIYAGAILVGQIFKNAVVYQEFDDGGIWVCTIRDGIPLPGFDLVTDDTEEAERIFSESLSYVNDIHIIGTRDDAQFSLLDVLNRADKKALSFAKLDKTVSPVLPVLALIILATSGFFAFEFLMEEEPAPQNYIMPQLPTGESESEKKAQEEAQKREQMLIESFLAEVEKHKHEFLSPGKNPIFLYETWMSTIRQLPLSVRGWVLSQADCFVTHCDFRWVRHDARAIPSAAHDIPGENLQMTADYSIRRIKLPVAEIPDAGQKGDRLSYAKIMDIPSFFAWQKDVVIIVDAPQDIVVSPPPQLTEKVAPVVLGKEGKLTINSKEISRVPHVLRFFDFQNIHIEKMTAHFDTGVITSVGIFGVYRLTE